MLLFTRARTPHWIQEYEATLRTNVWRLPWDDPLHMSWYVVVQERATQVTYQNTAAIARGEAPNPVFSADTDQVLAHVAQTVAIDEAVHRAGVYTRRVMEGDVLETALAQLSIAGLQALAGGVARSRQVPDADGHLRDTVAISGLDYGIVSKRVKGLYSRIAAYEQQTGLAEVDPTYFVSSDLYPAPAGYTTEEGNAGGKLV